MTTLTPRQKQDAAAAAKRARASALGHPTRRGTFPGTLPDPFIFFSSGRGLHASIPAGIEGLTPGVVKATADLIHVGLASREHTVIVPDRADQKLVTRMISREGTDVHARAWSAIKSTPKPFSFRTLTAALSYSWWAPDHMDIDDIDAWAEAFGVTSADRHTMLRQLADKASTVGKRLAHLNAIPSEVKQLVSRESWLVNGAKYPGLPADCRLHREIEKVTELQEALALADPGLLTHHEVDGSVTRMTDATDIGNSRVRFKLASPFRSKAGRMVVLTDGETSVQSGGGGIISSSFHGGSMFLVIEMRPRDMNWVDQTEKAGRHFFLREKPFDGFSKSQESTDRWQKPKEPPTPVKGREIPLDVILAGAPS